LLNWQPRPEEKHFQTDDPPKLRSNTFSKTQTSFWVQTNTMHGMQPGMSPSRQADSVAICHSLMKGFRTPDLPKIRHIATPEKNRKNRTVGNLKIYEVIYM